MANSPEIFSSLKGKKITLQGKFDRYQRPMFEEMIRSQQGKLVDDLDQSIDLLIVSDMSSGMPAQRKAQALNSKGATIQVLDIDGLDKIARPTDKEIVQAIRLGDNGASLLRKAMVWRTYRNMGGAGPAVTIAGEKFSGLNLSGLDFRSIQFVQCSFSKIVAEKTFFAATLNCDFTQANLKEAQLWEVSGSKLCNSNSTNTVFSRIDGADFSGATMAGCTFQDTPYSWTTSSPNARLAPPTFKRASLKEAVFDGPTIVGANFEQAELKFATFSDCQMRTASFQHANLESARFILCDLANADFSNANARDAIFEDTDLTGARFNGADLANVDFSSAKTDRVDFSTAKNYSPNSSITTTAGPA